MTWLPSRLWTRLNLAARLSLILTLSIIFVLIGAAYQSSRHIVHKTQGKLIAQYNEQMDMLESVIFSASFVESKAGRNFDLERLKGVISKFNYNPDVTQIGFRDTSDVTAFRRDIIISLEAPLFFAKLCGLEAINVNRPIIVDGVYYGLLSLSMSPNRIINEAWGHYRYLVRLLLLSLGIALFGIWFVLRKGLGPLLTLAEASQTLSRGDLSVRVEIAGSPEVQSVGVAFNRMASSFQATLSELQESEEKFKNIFDNSAIGKSITSLDGAVKVNYAFSSLLGYSIQTSIHS